MSRPAEALPDDPIIEVIDVPDPARYDELVAATEAALDQLEPLETHFSAADMLDRVRSGDVG
jgi:hypothetical protein